MGNLRRDLLIVVRIREHTGKIFCRIFIRCSYLSYFGTVPKVGFQARCVQVAHTGDGFRGKNGGTRKDQMMRGKKESPTQGCIITFTAVGVRDSTGPGLPREQTVFSRTGNLKDRDWHIHPVSSIG